MKTARKCWAESRGGCDKKMSGEHVFSKSLFIDKMVTILGTAQPLPSPVSLKNLRAKVLCKKHNEKLSDLDDEVGKLATFIRGASQTEIPRTERQQFDGRKLERWCLKTGYNILASRWAEPYGPQAAFHSDRSMVRLIFGDGQMSGTGGLYVLNVHGQRREGAVDQVVARMLMSDAGIIGVSISIAELNFIYWLNTNWTPEQAYHPSNPASCGVDWTKAEFTHRPTELRLEFARQEWGDKGASLVVNLVW
jgi:hypothetical protein